jgi:hypothetical protein
VALGSDLKKQQIKPEELEELLSGLEKLLDRTKILYEQYFMGIQKVAPMQLHRDIERRVRELMQQQIRNTSLRFRFTTLSQKFGAYNTYWKRTLREIEQGKYVRDLQRVKRKADQMGEDLPEELLVKLPKLVQDRIRRDRAKVAERALHDEQLDGPALEGAEPSDGGVHEISEDEAQTMFGDGDVDIDGLFAALTGPAAEGTQAPPVATTEPPAGNLPRVTMPMASGLGATRAVGSPSGPSFRVPLPGGAERSGGDESDVPDAVAAVDAVEAAEAAAQAEMAARAEATRTEATRTEATRGEAPRAEAPRAEAVPAEAAEVADVAERAEATRAEATRGEAPRAEATPAEAPRAEAARASGASQEPREVRRRTPPPVPRAAPAAVPGMDDRQCRDLYARYLKARQLVGASNDDVTYEKLVSSLSKQASAIMSEHGARGVEFHVVVRGDKVVLKAKPLKSGGE